MWSHTSCLFLKYHVRPATDGCVERKDCFPVPGGQLVPNESKEHLGHTPSQSSHVQTTAVQRCQITQLESFLRPPSAGTPCNLAETSTETPS